MSQADPAVRLAERLPRDGCRRALARLAQAEGEHRPARIASIEIDERGNVHLDVPERFTLEAKR